MERVAWFDGQLLSPEHLELQERFFRWQLLKIRRLFGVSGIGLYDSQLDLTAWNQGWIRWTRLTCISETGDDLELSQGVESLYPISLELPKLHQDSAQSLQLWVWPSSQEQTIDYAFQGLSIPVLRREWSQGFEVPKGVQGAICVMSWQWQDGAWTMDQAFVPVAIRPAASVHWMHALEEIRTTCLALSQVQGEDVQAQRALANFAALIPWLQEANPSELWRELSRLLILKGESPPDIPRFQNANPSAWLFAMHQQLKRSKGSHAQSRIALNVVMPRANQSLFSLTFRAEHWAGLKVQILWSRTIAFQGDELALLRVASLNQLPRLVRGAIPGIPLTALNAPQREGNTYSWCFGLDCSHPLWSDVLQQGTLAIHCHIAGDADSFTIRELL